MLTRVVPSPALYVRLRVPPAWSCRRLRAACPRGPTPLCVCRTRTSLGRAIRTAYRGTTGPDKRDLEECYCGPHSANKFDLKAFRIERMGQAKHDEQFGSDDAEYK